MQTKAIYKVKSKRPSLWKPESHKAIFGMLLTTAWKVFSSCTKRTSFTEILNQPTSFSTTESLRLEISMLLNTSKTLSQSPKLELLITHRLKYGVKSLTITKAIFGRWDVYFIKWPCKNHHSELKLLINFTKKSWLENTKK